MNDNKQLPLRIGVGIILLNQDNKIWVGKRIDNPKNFWQMPQGGVDENENFLQAAKRELEEETGVKSVKLIKELSEWFIYELPENLLGKVLEGKYRGQKQKWFIMKFTGKDSEININTKKPEFLDWRWADLETIADTVVDFKLKVYEQLIIEVKKIIPN